MGLTIYIRLNDEEAKLIKSVAGERHNRWAKRILLKKAGTSIPFEEVRAALEKAGFSEMQQELVLARFK